MRILVVEDDEAIRRLIAHTFIGTEIQADMADCCAAALVKLKDARYDILLFDIGLPDGTGLQLVKQIAIDPLCTGLVFLTGRSDAIDRVVGLEIGADDYIAKPFGPRELVARLRALYRRIEPFACARAEADHRGSKEFDLGNCSIDTRHRLVSFPDGKTEKLSSSDLDLLNFFLERPGQVATREQILNELYGASPPAFDRTIDLRISRLRKKLHDDPAEPMTIATVRNRGYRLNSHASCGMG